MNVDAALEANSSNMGLGWVLWDHHGNFLSAVSQPWNGSYYPEEAESLAIREALSWSKSQSLEHLHAETDSLMVVQRLSSAAFVIDKHYLYCHFNNIFVVNL